jgi:hypothetical protein
MGDIASRIAFNAAQMDDQNRQFALNFAPQLAQLNTLPGQLIAGVGASDEQYALEETSAASRNMMEFARLLQGFIPGANSTTTAERRSGGLETVGTLATIASLFL